MLLTDFSRGMVTEARQGLESVPSFGFLVADIQALPVAADSADVVVANHMLYHVPDRAEAFREIGRMLRLGGRLYAATVGAGHLREIDELVARFDPESFREDRFSSAFTLENGDAQLAPWFDRVTCEHYPNALIVTEAAPLIDYVLSGSRGNLARDRQEALAAFVGREVSPERPLRVSVDTGLFIAST